MKDPRVLVVDTFSGLNDYGVAMAMALARIVPLTFLTVSDTRLPRDTPCRLLDDIPQWGGNLGRAAKAAAFARYLAVLLRELWRHRHGAVHVQLFRLEGVDIWVYVLLRPFLRKIVYSAHNIYPHERKWWHLPLYRMWYRIVDEIHVLGNYSGEMLRSIGIPAERIHFIPHGDYALFKERHPPKPAEDVRREWGIASDDVVILFYGLIRDYKGLQRLIDAFCRLPDDSRAYLVVAGGGDRSQVELAEQKLRQAARSHRAALRFGFVPDPDLASLINASDIVAFPYLHIYQSGALMLAMTYGKAVIASDIDGFRDYVGGHDHARLIDTSSPGVFADTLLELVNDPDMRQRMATGALHRCELEFSWERIALQFQRLYE